MLGIIGVIGMVAGGAMTIHGVRKSMKETKEMERITQQMINSSIAMTEKMNFVNQIFNDIK